MSWTLRAGRRELTIPARAFVVGRGGDADLQLDDESISRRHAKLQVKLDGESLIEDLGSQNGTFVNGRAIIGCARIVPGDRIAFGCYELELIAPFGAGAFGHERPTEPLSRERMRSSEPAPSDSLRALSPREREVFVLLAEGVPQREIARQLGVSTKTVETHRTRIGHKLQIKSRADLVRCALDAGVLKAERQA